jgi:hypothetical protein
MLLPPGPIIDCIHYNKHPQALQLNSIRRKNMEESVDNPFLKWYDSKVVEKRGEKILTNRDRCDKLLNVSALKSERESFL